MINRSILAGWQKNTGVTLAFCLPFFILAPYVQHQVRDRVHFETERSASIVVNKVELMLDQVREGLKQRSLDSIPSCELWAERVRTLPYLRSAFLVKDEWIYCSSVKGSLRLPLGELLNGQNDFADSAFALTAGTPFAPAQPALVYYQKFSSDHGVVAIIDGQYLFDLLQDSSDPIPGKLSLRFGSAELNAHNHSIHLDLSGDSRVAEVVSSRYPLGVRAGINDPAVNVYRWELIYYWLPWSLLFGALLALLTYRVLSYRSSAKVELMLALAQNEFFVCYQPIINSSTGRCIGAEALLRWRHPVQGMVRPDIFIAQAEACGLIIKLTHRLFRCVQQDLGQALLPVNFHIGLNISSEHFSSSSLLSEFEQLRADLTRPDIVMVAEITERHIVSQDENTQAMFKSLRRAGIELAIDDFGTGQSSLGYLQHLDVDCIKIDKCFVSTIGNYSVNAPVLDAIINLAQRLKLKLVAEGVETHAQAVYLRDRGVDYLQGYLFAKPMPWGEFELWLHAHDGTKELGGGL